MPNGSLTSVGSQPLGKMRSSTLARQAVSVGTWNLASRAIAALGTMYAARCLGPAFTGMSGMVIATAQQAALVPSAGLDPVAVRRLAGDRQTGGELVRGILWLRLTLLLPVTALWVTMALRRSPARGLWLMGLPLLLNSACTLSFAFQAAEAVPRLSAITALGSLATSSLYFLLLVPGMPIGSDLRIQAAVVLITWLITVFESRRLWGPLAPSVVALRGAAALLRQSWRYWLQAVVASFYTLFQIPLIAWLLGAADAGQYRVALSLASGVDVAFVSLASVLLPRMARWNAVGPDYFHRQLRRLNRALVAIAVPSILLAIAAVPFVVPVLLGPAYHPAVPILEILLLARLAVLLGQTYSQALIAMARDRIFLGISLVATIFSISASLLVIPAVGVRGAALVSLMTEFLILIAMANSVSRGLRAATRA